MAIREIEEAAPRPRDTLAQHQWHGMGADDNAGFIV